MADMSHKGDLGRSRELATAAFARDTARAGTGSVLAITGAAGIGKTWLCEAIADAAGPEGFRVGWGSCWPGDGAPPLWPWRQAVTELGGPPPPDLFDAPPAVGSEDWFMRGVAVVDHLRTLTAGQPSILVIDDAHDADEQTQQLAHFVARHVRGLPLVLIVAHQPSDALAGLGRVTTPLALHGFAPADAAELLGARGIEGLTDADLTFLVAATGGLPLGLHRLANTAPARDAATIVRALVDERLTGLPPEIVQGAACAAILDRAPRLRDVAAVVAENGTDPLAIAVELERLGLAHRSYPDLLRFGHDQVRAALIATLDPCEVFEVHAWAAHHLGDDAGDGLVTRARHAVSAAPRSDDDADFALRSAADAAHALLADDAPEQAAALLTIAEQAHAAAGLGRPPAAFLAAQAAAAQRCGLLGDARELYDKAATAADDEGDAVSLASAAAGLGGVWLAETRSAIDTDRILTLQRRARDGLDADQVALRLRLDVRLAAEWAYATGELDGVQAKVDEARALDDPAVLAEALSLYHHAMLGPRYGDERIAVAHEMLAAATRANNGSQKLMALLWLTADQFLLGSGHALRSLGELHERADAAGERHARYIARVMDAMVLQRAGKLDEAERTAEEAFALGAEVGDADAVAYYGAQIATLRWMQGRASEVLALAAETAASPTITPQNRVFVAMSASLSAAGGELALARAALSRLRGGLGTVHHSSVWLGTLYSVVEAAHIVDDAAIAEEAGALLAPYADLPVLGSLGITCVGVARRSLGLAALTCGRLDEAVAELEQAVVGNQRLGNRPMVALTVADLALARATRGAPGDREAAVDLLDQAIREADAMGMGARVDEWRSRRSGLVVDPPAAAASRPAIGDVGRIERRGAAWVLTAGTDVAVLPDLLGMTYLAQLLTNPGVEIAAAALAAAGDDDLSTALAGRPEQPVLDDAALAAYRRRITDLEDDLAEAERNADPEWATRVRMELDAVVDELTRTTNRFGRSRAFASTNEHARTAVQKALRRVLSHIDNVTPALGTPLRAAIHTGRTCSYTPGPDLPARWTHAS
jgi:tetratricopeptide (TPR) repeat protein